MCWSTTVHYSPLALKLGARLLPGKPCAQRRAGSSAAAMSVEETQAMLEQFKQNFFSEPTDVDSCAALLPKLKVCARIPPMNCPPLARALGSRSFPRLAAPGKGVARRLRAGERNPYERGFATTLCTAPSLFNPPQAGCACTASLRATTSHRSPLRAPTACGGEVPDAAPAADGGHQPAGAHAREYVSALPPARSPRRGARQVCADRTCTRLGLID